MPLTAEEQALRRQVFSSSNPAHCALVETKLNALELQLVAMKKDMAQIGVSILGGLIAAISGRSQVLGVFRLEFLMGFFVGVNFKEISKVNKDYRDALTVMLDLYDWCIPAEGTLPPISTPVIPRMLRTMGSLISQSKIKRLEGYMPDVNQSVASSIWNWGTSFFSSTTDTTELVANLLSGQSYSWYAYVLFGEGSAVFDTALNYTNKAFEASDSLFETLVTYGSQIQQAAEGAGPHAKAL